ncbi:hypothetical protein CAPTEDRAFT_205423 [Capitella teleta]|uniref:G-protein coupled receptors family 1 profile domain-containing protein n=1 Tax=Capitella teleta TaxID=283909 RepID=R7TKZ5_CAPTE|nr:hypothetical protein CAPTEDRAFT_205423 [Capitella teleta]|eukprot:ELT91780.1 hypothetical protein CAPTEDRAFT_205423 [Capitella teleta]
MEVGYKSNESFLFPSGLSVNGSWVPPHDSPDYTGTTFQRILERYITTSICAFGFFGNVVNLLVLTQAGYRKSEGMKENGAHIGLVALAVSDMLFCLAMCPRGFMGEKISLFQEYNFYLVYQTYGTGFITTLILTSTWITCTMALLRYIGICHPLRARNLDGPLFARVAYPCVFVSCVVFNLPTFFQYKASLYMIEGERYHLMDLGYMDVNLTRGRVFFWMKIIFAIIIPAAILIFCNFSLVMALRRSYRMRRECHVKDTQNHARNRITLTLIIIATSFVILGFPSEIVDLDLFQESIKANTNKTELFLQLRVIANLMQVLNFSLNFVLYCVINVHFRKTIRDFFRRSRSRSRPGSVTSRGRYMSRFPSVRTSTTHL